MKRGVRAFEKDCGGLGSGILRRGSGFLLCEMPTFAIYNYRLLTFSQPNIFFLLSCGVDGAEPNPK